MQILCRGRILALFSRPVGMTRKNKLKYANAACAIGLRNISRDLLTYNEIIWHIVDQYDYLRQ